MQDEARIGQKNKLTYQWALKGTRPPQVADQRFATAYIFGAVCPSRGVGVAWIEPWSNTQAMQVHLDEISKHVLPNNHAVLLMDGAGWHKSKALKIPPNITIIFIPPYSPELNPMENIWQYIRQNWLSNKVFEDYDDIVESCCNAWNNLMKTPEIITSIAHRTWFEPVKTF